VGSNIRECLEQRPGATHLQKVVAGHCVPTSAPSDQKCPELGLWEPKLGFFAVDCCPQRLSMRFTSLSIP